MENKLQQLTQKLYDEGLERGRTESDRLIAEAQERAQQIVAQAQAEAQAIVKGAQDSAEDAHKNAMTEIALAGKQAVAKIKSEIAEMIVAKSTSQGVKSANLDAKFIKEMLLAVAANWNGTQGVKSDLNVLLPEGAKASLDKEFAAVAKELLTEGIEVGYSSEVKSGFKISEKGGGYYISFSDSDFEALLGGYLREKLYNLLYKA